MMETSQTVARGLALGVLLIYVVTAAPADGGDMRSFKDVVDIDDFIERARKLFVDMYNHPENRRGGSQDGSQPAVIGSEDDELQQQIRKDLDKAEDDEGLSEARRRAADFIESADGEHHKKVNLGTNPDENDIEAMVQDLQDQMSETSTPEELVNAVAQAIAKTGLRAPQTMTVDASGRSQVRTLAKEKRLAFTNDMNNRWQDGKIVYTFDTTSRLSETSEANVRLAMSYMESVTCLKFYEYYDGIQSDLGLTHNSVIGYGDFGGCWSYVGPINRLQHLSPCAEYGIGITLHEILHALAGKHEQSRSDRDQWIEVLYQNTGPNGNFDKGNTDDRVPYDYGSVMQYSLYSFSTNGKPSLNIFDRKMEFLVGQRHGELSFLDIESININYMCVERKCPAFSTLCQNGGFVGYTNGACRCVCSYGMMGDDCSQLFRPQNTPTEWPSGNYATFRPAAGCPDDENFVHGLRPMRTKWYNVYSGNHFPAEYRPDRTSTPFPFCSTDGTINTGHVWPAGGYCLFRKGGSCPDGFNEGWAQFDELDNTADSVDGTIPDGVYDSNTRFFYCCRNDRSASTLINMPLDKPFYLLKNEQTGKCQAVEGAKFVEEYFTTKIQGEDIVEWHHPSPIKDWAITNWNTMYSMQCYYTPIDYNCGGIWNLDTSSNEVTITSPNYPGTYGTDQMCFYLIHSPANTLMKIQIDDFDLEKNGDNCRDELEIRHNHISQPHARYCGDYYRGIFLTNYNSTMLVFRSDSTNGDNRGFKATVSVVYETQVKFNVGDRGRTYHGDVNYTQNHKPCVPWAEAAQADCTISPWKGALGIGLDNKCRNPNGAEQPWCYIDMEDCDTDYCDVSNLTTCYDRVSNCADLLASNEDYCQGNYSDAFKNCHKSCKLCGLHTANPVACSRPDSTQYASIAGELKNSYSVGETVKYTCNNGFGYQERTCLTDGTWSGQDRMCGSCPDGWANRGGHCYGFFSESKLYRNADSHCKEIGAELVSFSDADEQAFVDSIAENYYWIGLDDLESEGTFEWQDGSEYGAYTNWAPGAPGTDWWKDCVYVQFNDDRKWEATYSEWGKPYVCEANLGNECWDARTDCASVVTRYPEACSKAAFAGTQCRRTCGLCPDDSIDFPTEAPTEPSTMPTNGPSSTPSVISTTPSGRGECREGYVMHGTSCYSLVTIKPLSFSVADEFCRTSGGHLVSITNPDEYDFVTSLLPDEVSLVAIGITDVDSEGDFVYVEDGSPIRFAAWADGQPTDVKAIYDCVFMSSDVDYKYKTLKCGIKANFVCEYNLMNVSSLTFTGPLPHLSSIMTEDASIKDRLYIPRPKQTLAAGNLVGFRIYTTQKGEVFLLILRPTSYHETDIAEVQVVDYTIFDVTEKSGQLRYIQLEQEVPVEDGDVVGFFFPGKNPVAFTESQCEYEQVFGSAMKRLQEEILLDNWGFCRDYFLEVVVNAETGKRYVVTEEDQVEKTRDFSTLARFTALLEEAQELTA